MALPFFYEPSIVPAQQLLSLTEETSRHCVQVLRMKQGDELQLTDGKGKLFTARLTRADKKKSEAAIENTQAILPAGRKVCIAVSLLKNSSRFEWFLEKATELGVQEIIPLRCSRTERQQFRYERLNGILISAMLQSQQAWLPVLQQPIAFEKMVTDSAYAQKLVAHCEEDEKNAIHNIGLGNDVQILIGPEGDFSPAEIKLALQHQFMAVTLGNTRLRTETAAITAAALLINYP